MEDILAETPEVTSGAVVEGTVVGQVDPHLLVNVGLKQEAAIPLAEFAGDVPQMGASIPVFILRIHGPEGRPLASWKQAREHKYWESVHVFFEKKQPIEGKVVRKVKGGVIVDIGLDAFMPASQIDLKPTHNLDSWIGHIVNVMVLEMDRSKSNVLVSRRHLLEQEKAVKKAATLESLKVNEVVKGKVTGLTNFGAFIDIGGAEGLLHVSDLDWVHKDAPQKILKVGQEIEVKILKYDPQTQRISLGRKQLLPHPWDGIEKKYPIGSVVKAKVSAFAPFGAFVQIESGIDGMVHNSELSWNEHIKHANQKLKLGQSIEVKVIGVDRDKEKISLSLKRMGPNPWEEAAKLYKVNSQLDVEVTHTAPFGVFVRVPNALEALIRTQDFSWTQHGQNPKQMFKPGDKLKAVVLDVNVKEEKMALGIKQLTPDPMSGLKVGSTVTGKISSVSEFGLFVKLDSGLDALVRSNEIQTTRSKFGEDSGPVKPHEYKVGDEISASVIKINKKDRKIDLSIRKYDRVQERELLKKYSGQKGNPTLGEATGWMEE